MLTRLKISGFKNLVDVDVSFGPFTCIAGPNGVGKSNLFDAIQFLSLLADKTVREAALSVRTAGKPVRDVRSIFHHVGDAYDNAMRFEAEMIVPQEAVDDFGQTARATSTFLRYVLVLEFVPAGPAVGLTGDIRIREERLEHIKKEEVPRKLFPHATDWRKSVIRGGKTVPYISTNGETIIIRQDRRAGRASPRHAATLPRTVLSSASAEYPTVLVARREMQSWRMLQLEPSSLRQPDEFSQLGRLATDGAHLPATLSRLSGLNKLFAEPPKDLLRGHAFYAELSNRVSQLIGDIRDVWVEPDLSGETLTLKVSDLQGTEHPARLLSDGTLRFLALATLELDPEETGLMCLEEPENGIHPERIPAVLDILGGIAGDVWRRSGDNNPLRQVFINTHSPSVVSQIPDESLLVAVLEEKITPIGRGKCVDFRPLPDTWRAKLGHRPCAKGSLMMYLNPFMPREERIEGRSLFPNKKLMPKDAHPRAVIEREDLQIFLFQHASNRRQP